MVVQKEIQLEMWTVERTDDLRADHLAKHWADQLASKKAGQKAAL